MDVLPTELALQPGQLAHVIWARFRYSMSRWSYPIVAVAIKETYSLSEGFVATSAGSDNQGIGIMYIVGLMAIPGL